MPLSTTIRGTTQFAAVAMVVSSAGFGAIFAYRIGIEHSFALALLTVLFVVALELLKPVAIANAFVAFASWQVVRGLCLTLLGVIAIAYSLTAELALTAQSRGDLAAKRVAETNHVKVSASIYSTAVEELKALVPSRAIAEINADAMKLKAEHKGYSCEPMGGPVSRYVCPKLETLKGEAARQKRREHLQSVVERYVSNSSSDQVERIADPGSSAIALYLAALGIVASASTIAQWLNLVPVLALELGSALSMVLVGAVSGSQQTISVGSIDPLGSLVAHKKETRREMRLRRRVAGEIVDHLTKNGGSLSHSERELAAMLNQDRNTVKRAILDLGATGKITHQPSKKGTTLKLLH